MEVGQLLLLSAWMQWREMFVPCHHGNIYTYTYITSQSRFIHIMVRVIILPIASFYLMVVFSWWKQFCWPFDCSGGFLEGKSFHLVLIPIIHFRIWVILLLYFTFYRILLCRDTSELANVVLSPYCRRLSEDCDDFPFGDARVGDKLGIFISESIVLDNPRLFREPWH